MCPTTGGLFVSVDGFSNPLFLVNIHKNIHSRPSEYGVDELLKQVAHAWHHLWLIDYLCLHYLTNWPFLYTAYELLFHASSFCIALSKYIFITTLFQTQVHSGFFPDSLCKYIFCNSPLTSFTCVTWVAVYYYLTSQSLFCLEADNAAAQHFFLQFLNFSSLSSRLSSFISLPIW